MFTAFETLKIRLIIVSRRIVGVTRLKKGQAGPSGLSLAGTVGSNPVREMDVCLSLSLSLVSFMFVVRLVSLRRADHSSR